LINTLSWSPVGERLIYVYQSNPGQFMPSELRLVNADGSDDRLLATDLPMPGEPRYRPVWSPDGRHVAFVQLDNPPTFHPALALASGNMYLVDTLTRRITKLSSFEKRDITYPTWAPNGRLVAFVSTLITDDESLYGEVWVASADGNQLYAVSGTAKWYNTLAWLPAVSSSEGR
jgi:Tol biopolymer transport system component